jgi:hypothetical protein
MRITFTLWVAFMLSILGTASVSASLGFELGKQSVPAPVPFSPADFIKSNKEQVNNVCYVWWFKTPPKDKVLK